MKRTEIIKELKQYFSLKELVCKHVYNKYVEQSIWMFFSTEALETLLVLRRDIIKRPFIINNWSSGSNNYTQRGLRCNLCALVKEKTNLEKVYMSAHIMGKAFDITVVGMDAETARQLIKKNQNKLPHPIRLEDKVSWLHVDVYTLPGAGKITMFEG